MKKILVIEDEHPLRAEIVDLLRFEGYEVIAAENGRVGLQQAREQLPDLIISDIMMPELDGYDVLLELRCDPATQTIPFIFLTAKSDRLSQRKGMAIGADDYLTKPVLAGELLVAVKTRLARQSIMLRDISRRIEELDLLRQVDQELSYRLRPDWVITIMMDWALRRTNAKTAIMGTVEQDDQQLRLQYTATQLKDNPPQKGDLWPLDGTVGKIIRSEHPIFIDDLRLEKSFTAVDPNSVALLGIPLSTANSVLGALILESDHPGAFTPDDVAFLSQMANRTAVALEHANLFRTLIQQQEQELALREMFGRFVSQDVAAVIQSGGIQLIGESRIVSVLFCDIRHFTVFSENHTPEQAVALLNEYLPLVVNAAKMNGGMVNKFGGDSTLLIFGAPTLLAESAYHAILTALQLRSSLERLNAHRSANGNNPIQIGMGINTGKVVAGAVGPEERQEYTVIGDTVNLASRIEALNKEYPEHDILISEYTYDALGERRAALEFKNLGKRPIRGKTHPIEIWAVIGFTESSAGWA